jgi:hypothetical protein
MLFILRMIKDPNPSFKKKTMALPENSASLIPMDVSIDKNCHLEGIPKIKTCCDLPRMPWLRTHQCPSSHPSPKSLFQQTSWMMTSVLR